MDINSFLKEIEAESAPDLSFMDDHWMDMQKVLIKEHLSVHHGTIVNPAVVYLTLAGLVSLCFLINIISVSKGTITIDHAEPAHQKPVLNNNEFPAKKEHTISNAKDSLTTADTSTAVKRKKAAYDFTGTSHWEMQQNANSGSTGEILNSKPLRHIPSSGSDSIANKSRKRLVPPVKDADSQQQSPARRYRQ